MSAKSVLLCKAADLSPGAVRRVEHPDCPAIAVYNVDGVFYATDDNCTHGLSSLAEGLLDGDVIECAAHFGGLREDRQSGYGPLQHRPEDLSGRGA